MPDAANANLVSETVVDAEIAEDTPVPAAASTPPEKAPKSRRNLTTIAAISFSLTFVGVSVAFLAGVLPRDLAALDLGVDMGVVLLMVPVCALVLATLLEVVRTAIRGLPRIRPPRPATILSAAPASSMDWRPALRER